jgi:hypothetical protein
VTFLPGRAARQQQEEVHEEETRTYVAAAASSRANFADARDLVGSSVAVSSPRSSASPVSLAAILRDAVRYWRRHFWYLTSISMLLWLPLAVLELSGAHGVDIDTDHFRVGDVVANLVIVLVFELLVAEILAAASEKIVASDLQGLELPRPRQFLATVPWFSLVLGTLVYEIGVGVGLLFFVVPGYVIAVWGVVTGPVIVAERRRALQAPMRSRELVRGSFRPVALFVLLAFVVSEAISSGAGALLDLLPQSWAEPTGEYVVHVATSPLFGMATAVLYYALVARERARTRDEPAGAGSSQ